MRGVARRIGQCSHVVFFSSHCARTACCHSHLVTQVAWWWWWHWFGCSATTGFKSMLTSYSSLPQAPAHRAYLFPLALGGSLWAGLRQQLAVEVSSAAVNYLIAAGSAGLAQLRSVAAGWNLLESLLLFAGRHLRADPCPSRRRRRSARRPPATMAAVGVPAAGGVLVPGAAAVGAAPPAAGGAPFDFTLRPLLDE